MLRMTFEVDGVVQLDRAISRFADSVEDFTPIWPGVEEELRGIEAEQFQSQGHGSWAPLSPRYAAWKAVHYPGRPLLVRTDALRSSLTSSPNVRRSPRRLELLSPHYWIYHQRGTSRMPQRKIVDLRDPDKRRVMRAVQGGLVREARKAGLS